MAFSHVIHVVITALMVGECNDLKAWSRFRQLFSRVECLQYFYKTFLIVNQAWNVSSSYDRDTELTIFSYVNKAQLIFVYILKV